MRVQSNTDFLDGLGDRAIRETKEEDGPVDTIKAVEVKRDDLGHWTHPQFPDWDEGTPSSEIEAWFQQRGLKHAVSAMEYEVDTEIDPYFNDGYGSCSHWEPVKPEGDGWFVLSIHETEESGPVCVWVRST